MTTIKKYNYRGWEVEVYYDNYNTPGFTATSRHLSTFNPKGGLNGTFPTEKDAIQAIETKIQEIMGKPISSYLELTKKLQESLIWTSSEDCYLDVDTVKMLVENFNNFNHNE